jgi:hypothetical protein
MITTQQVQDAMECAPRALAGNPTSEKGIRIAYEWLDAQRKTKSQSHGLAKAKGIIEVWSASYVSVTDVEIAESLHPDVTLAGSYLNLSKRLTRPNIRRLEGIVDLETSPTIGATHEAYPYSQHES